jgi:hypothetical protein
MNEDGTELGLFPSINDGRMVWVRIGKSKFHMVEWAARNARQDTACGKFLQMELGSTFKRDMRPTFHIKGLSVRCATCERMTA